CVVLVQIQCGVKGIDGLALAVQSVEQLTLVVPRLYELWIEAQRSFKGIQRRVRAAKRSERNAFTVPGGSIVWLLFHGLLKSGKRFRMAIKCTQDGSLANQ